VEVGFEPTDPRIFPDFVLEYAGRGGIPELGISLEIFGFDPDPRRRAEVVVSAQLSVSPSGNQLAV
jgi:hypothetical protein